MLLAAMNLEVVKSKERGNVASGKELQDIRGGDGTWYIKGGCAA